MTTHWIARAERALNGSSEEGVTVVPTSQPNVLDRDGTRAAASPFFAAFFWGAAVLHEQINGPSLDVVQLLLRFLAIAFSARSVLALGMLAGRLRLRARARRFGLALTEEGLLLRTPEGDIAVPKAEIVAIKEPGAMRERGSAYTPVYLVTRPQNGRPFVELPPVLDASPRALSERLMRWTGPVSGPESYVAPKPSQLPSKVYEAAARGEGGQDTVIIRHGTAWLRRGPYATVLLGLAVSMSYLRLPGEVKMLVGAIAPSVAVIALLFVPALWVVLIRIDIHPRKGLSLVMTPSEVIMRSRAGVHVVPWSDLKRASVAVKRTWSLLRGVHDTRALVLERGDGDTISYIESFLGAPAEVVAGLCDGYRKGLLGAEAAAAEQTS